MSEQVALNERDRLLQLIKRLGDNYECDRDGHGTHWDRALIDNELRWARSLAAAEPKPRPQKRCSACGCPLVFARERVLDAHGATYDGHRQPLDLVSPVYRLLVDGTCERVRDCFVQHFRSCSDPKRFSKKR